MKEPLKMKLRKSSGSIRNQVGFTLIELLIGIAITGLIIGGISTAIYQVMNINALDSSRMTAVKQIENAIDTIRPDVIAAQIIPDSASSTLILTSVRWSDNKEYSITYSRLNNNLVREESINHGASTSKVVAQHIDGFTWQKDSSGKITIVLSATVSSFRSASETRTFHIFPRSTSS
jgi:prepilin-type N-terminal cleavage/methylation domain-containing protein